MKIQSQLLMKIRAAKARANQRLARKIELTFTFTVDALPGYTKFNKKKKVLACIQIIESDKDEETKREPCEVAGE